MDRVVRLVQVLHSHFERIFGLIQLGRDNTDLNRAILAYLARGKEREFSILQAEEFALNDLVRTFL